MLGEFPIEPVGSHRGDHVGPGWIFGYKRKKQAPGVTSLTRFFPIHSIRVHSSNLSLLHSRNHDPMQVPVGAHPRWVGHHRHKVIPYIVHDEGSKTSTPPPRQPCI